MIAFLLLLLSITHADFDSGTGHLLVYKTINCLSCDVFGVGHNVTVNIEVTNMGDGSAYAVEVNDTVPNKFELVEGSLKGSLGEILSGDTATWSYKAVTDKTQLIVKMEPATITYKRKENAEVSTLISATPSQRSRVIPNFEYARMFQSHYLDYFIMTTLVFLGVPLPGFVWWSKQSARS